MNGDVCSSVSSVIELGLFGIAFADAQGVVTETHGDLSFWLSIGDCVTDSSIAFIGMEAEFEALKDNPKKRLTLPDLTFSEKTQDCFHTIYVQWDPKNKRYAITTTQVEARDNYLVAVTQLARAKAYYQDQIETERQHFRAIYENTPHMVFCFLFNGELCAASTDFKRQFLSSRELVDINIHDDFFDDHLFSVLRDSDVWDLVWKGQRVQDVPFKVVDTFGIIRDLEISGLVMNHPTLKSPEAYFTLNDVTARNIALSALKAHAHELQILSNRLASSNQRFEKFATVAAHDLLAPLRRISKLSNIINSEFSGVASDSLQLAINEINKAAHQGRKLVNDVMDLSRVTSMNSSGDQISPAAIMRTIEEEYVFDIEEVNGRVAYLGEEFMVQGDENLFLQIYRNLISNAIKYRSQNRSLVVTHGIKQESNGDIIISFSDNGRGFDNQNSVEVFGPFVRLSNQVGIQGSGIGLAIVKEAADSLNCEVSAESETDQGTTIYLRFFAEH